jgi:hypothetical protein
MTICAFFVILNQDSARFLAETLALDLLLLSSGCINEPSHEESLQEK